MKKKTFFLTVIFTLLLLVCCKTLHIPSSNFKILDDNLISIDRATEIKNRYETERIDLLENQLKELYNNNDFRDSKFAWFSLEKMKAYIDYIESIKAANPKEKVSGIRIYFGTYPNDSSREKHPGKQTFFMVPTVKTGFNDPEFKIINHLPFEIQPNSPNTPLKGDFIILDDLMLGYKKDIRLRSHRSNDNSRQIMALALPAANADTNSVTRTILNEAELAPPPE